MIKKLFIFLYVLIPIYLYSQDLSLGIENASKMIMDENQKLAEELDSPSKVYNFILKYENRFKLDINWGVNKKIYESGVETAIVNSRITKFYIGYCLNNNKSFSHIPFPKLDSIPYNKLNDIIKEYNLNIVKHNLIRSMSLKLMDCMLVEEYFGINFMYGDVHEIVNNMETDYNSIFYLFTDENSNIRKILSYKDKIAFIKMIDKYIYYQ